MSERVVYQLGKLDKIIWSASKVGTYLVKEGYAILIQAKHDRQPQ